MQKYPRSWKALVAEDMPDPLRPVMMTISGEVESADDLVVFLRAINCGGSGRQTEGCFAPGVPCLHQTLRSDIFGLALFD